MFQGSEKGHWELRLNRPSGPCVSSSSVVLKLFGEIQILIRKNPKKASHSKRLLFIQWMHQNGCVIEKKITFYYKKKKIAKLNLTGYFRFLSQKLRQTFTMMWVMLYFCKKIYPISAQIVFVNCQIVVYFINTTS